MCEQYRRVSRMLSRCAGPFIVVVALAALGQSSALGQAALTRQAQIDVIDREIRSELEALEKYRSGDYFLTTAIYDSEGLTLTVTDLSTDELFSRVSKDTGRSPVMIVPISKADMINRITMRVITGDLEPGKAGEIATRLRKGSARLADELAKHIQGMRLLKERMLKQGQTAEGVKPVNPTGGGQRFSGYWRLKDGYPRFKQKEQCPSLMQKYTRVELGVGSSVIDIDYANLHGGTKEVTHAFVVHVSFDGLGKATYDPGQESTFKLDGSWTWTKDGGAYTAAYPVLGYTGGVAILQAEPRHGTLSASDSARLWLGRVSSGVAASDRRAIIFKVPSSGKEFTLDMGVVNYGGANLVTWAYEWVVR